MLAAAGEQGDFLHFTKGGAVVFLCFTHFLFKMDKSVFSFPSLKNVQKDFLHEKFLCHCSSAQETHTFPDLWAHLSCFT